MKKCLIAACALSVAACSSPNSSGGTSAHQALDESSASLFVNGSILNSREAHWMIYVATDVVPKLAGSRDERLDTAATVAWWSLKEGLFDTPDPIGFSKCSTSGGDVNLGPYEACDAGSAWQVGLAAVQVTGKSLAEVEHVAAMLYGDSTQALLNAGEAEGVDVTDTWGSLRTSWLLRDPAVGFTFEAPAITSECLTNGLNWCFSDAWYTSALYAPDQWSASRSIANIRDILDANSP